MWWIKTDSSGEDRGGFQNRDSGRTLFNNDYGPDFGVDYARFSDPPDLMKDLKLQNLISSELKKFENDLYEYEMKVRNGFVILKGYVRNVDVQKSIFECVYATDGVKEVINNLHIYNPSH